MITLYPYQDQWVTDIRKAYNGGAQAVLAVLPTGGGKTICFSWLAMRMAGNRKRVLILCHRKELMRQISEALSQFGIYHGLINAAHTPDLSALVQVGTIATVINRTHLYTHFDYIIMDEAHHAVADTWRTGRMTDRRIMGESGEILGFCVFCVLVCVRACVRALHSSSSSLSAPGVSSISKRTMAISSECACAHAPISAGNRSEFSPSLASFPIRSA